MHGTTTPRTATWAETRPRRRRCPASSSRPTSKSSKTVPILANRDSDSVGRIQASAEGPKTAPATSCPTTAGWRSRCATSAPTMPTRNTRKTPSRGLPEPLGFGTAGAWPRATAAKAKRSNAIARRGTNLVNDVHVWPEGLVAARRQHSCRHGLGPGFDLPGLDRSLTAWGFVLTQL